MEVATIGAMKRTTTGSTTSGTSNRPAAAPRVVKARAPRAAKTTEAATMVNESAIATRAYEIFKSRNGEPGDPISDWLQAEHELRTAN